MSVSRYVATLGFCGMAFSLLDRSSTFVPCLPLVGASAHSTSRCRAGLSASAHLCQGRLSLGEPEGHVHGAVQRYGCGQGGACWLRAARLDVEGAQTQVAVRLQG